MRKKVLTSLFIILILSFFCVTSHSMSLTLNSTPVRKYFSPDGGCIAAIVKQTDNATEALVQAYSFTLAPIAKALVNAKKRAVSVEVTVDKSQRKELKKQGASYKLATFSASTNIPTYVGGSHSIAHNKIIIKDKQIVKKNSFIFSEAEEKTAENLLILKNPELANTNIDNLLKHKAHSEKLMPRY